MGWRDAPAAPAPSAQLAPERDRAPAPGAVLTGVAASAGVAIGPAFRLGGLGEAPAERAAQGARGRGCGRWTTRSPRRRGAIERDRRYRHRPARARPTPRSSTPTWRCSTTRRCSSRRAPRSRPAPPPSAAWETPPSTWRRGTGASTSRCCRSGPPTCWTSARRVLAAPHRRAAPSGRRGVRDRRGRELTPADARGPRPARVLAHRHRARRHLARRDPRPRARHPRRRRPRRGRAGRRATGTLLLDGEAGTVKVDPGDDVVGRARARRERAERRRAARASARRARRHCATASAIEVAANLGAPADAAGAVELGAEGVGLLRTEFLFLGRDEPPERGRAGRDATRRSPRRWAGAR